MVRRETPRMFAAWSIETLRPIRGSECVFEAGMFMFRGLRMATYKLLLLPGDVNVREGVLLRLRQSKVGTVNKHDVNLLDSVRRAFKSFDFGTDRAKW